MSLVNAEMSNGDTVRAYEYGGLFVAGSAAEIIAGELHPEQLLADPRNLAKIPLKEFIEHPEKLADPND